VTVHPAFNADLSAVEKALGAVTYKPGWRIRPFLHEFEGVWLAITYDDANTYRPDEPWSVRVNSPVPPVYDNEAFWLWLQHRLIRIETHECREWFRVGGKPFRDPHDPHANDDAPAAHQKGVRVRITDDKKPGWMRDTLGTVQGFNGQTYEVLVYNKAGFPWLVQLSPSQIETP
jgi:hypothetical protein